MTYSHSQDSIPIPSHSQYCDLVPFSGLNSHSFLFPILWLIPILRTEFPFLPIYIPSIVTYSYSQDTIPIPVPNIVIYSHSQDAIPIPSHSQYCDLFPFPGLDSHSHSQYCVNPAYYAAILIRSVNQSVKVLVMIMVVIVWYRVTKWRRHTRLSTDTLSPRAPAQRLCHTIVYCRRWWGLGFRRRHDGRWQPG